MRRICLFRMLCAFTVAICAGCSESSERKDIIYACDEYTVYTDSVVQGAYTAKAVSPLEIITDYKSRGSGNVSPAVTFRFSINGRDNELFPWESHYALVNEADSAKIYQFGNNDSDGESIVSSDTLKKNADWTVRVDMRHILRDFDRYGYYVTPVSDTIYAEDFKGIWIAGNIEPLNWDFKSLYANDNLRLTDRGDSIYELNLVLNPANCISDDPAGWRIGYANKGYPTYSSHQLLVDAVYNMGIDGIASDTISDGTLVPYAIYLSLAYLDPVRSMDLLRAKVKNGRIVQELGAGGVWPVSSDRVAWAIAAWEVFKVTGDKDWLREARNVIAATIDTDLEVIWDKGNKLFCGGQSSIDRVGQMYPDWMQPADIYESMCLGTNVIYSQALGILSMMDAALGSEETSKKYCVLQHELSESINANLWIPNKGYYSGCLYGGLYPLQSQIADNLGQALGIIFGVASRDMAASIMKNTPRKVFGIPVTTPHIKDINSDHKDIVMPFVQAFWNLAAAKVRNESALCAGLGAMYRAAALFGAHKDSFMASNGDFNGVATNSDSRIGSCAGAVAMNFRIFAGISFDEDGISFSPFVPEMLSGDKIIDGFAYRGSNLKIIVSGTGERISAFSIDGKIQEVPFFSAEHTGNHEIRVVMTGKPEKTEVNIAEQDPAPPAPVVVWDNYRDATIVNHNDSVAYMVYLNGVFERLLRSNMYEHIDDSDVSAFVNIIPVADNRIVGFSGRTHLYIPQGAQTIVQMEDVAVPGTVHIGDKLKAANFVEVSVTRNRRIEFEVNIPDSGTYFIDLRYANGSGYVNSEKGCAIRMLYVNNERTGALIFPQRGAGEWLSAGFSNMLAATLHKGNNKIAIVYEKPYCDNMNGKGSTALLDYLRIIKK